VSKRFSKAWPAVISGDPKQYSQQLKAQGYFTADLSGYSDSLASIFKDLLRLKIDYDSLPSHIPSSPNNEGFSEEEKQRILNLVTLTMRSEMEEPTIWSPPSEEV
jgi:hypothetical protein